jgi:hypothetical protein
MSRHQGCNGDGFVLFFCIVNSLFDKQSVCHVPNAATQLKIWQQLNS